MHRFFLSFGLILSFSLFAKTVEYELVIENKEVEVGGKTYKKFTVNGGIPAPVLRFEIGDYAKIDQPEVIVPISKIDLNCKFLPIHLS
ncbi:MAG: hypothetical protein H6620_07465 [Halobacteriovoraceae bacterium]|nr:hypothetical protein [Halobacteriovoraceae bacterium]